MAKWENIPRRRRLLSQEGLNCLHCGKENPTIEYGIQGEYLCDECVEKDIEKDMLLAKDDDCVVRTAFNTCVNCRGYIDPSTESCWCSESPFRVQDFLEREV